MRPFRRVLRREQTSIVPYDPIDNPLVLGEHFFIAAVEHFSGRVVVVNFIVGRLIFDGAFG